MYYTYIYILYVLYICIIHIYIYMYYTYIYIYIIYIYMYYTYIYIYVTLSHLRSKKTESIHLACSTPNTVWECINEKCRVYIKNIHPPRGCIFFIYTLHFSLVHFLKVLFTVKHAVVCGKKVLFTVKHVVACRRKVSFTVKQKSMPRLQSNTIQRTKNRAASGSMHALSSLRND